MSFKIVCLECNQPVANSNNILGRHVRTTHKMEWDVYLVKHHYDGSWPICKCGCGEKIKWKKGGFPKYQFGHHARGKNNSMYGKRGKDSPNYGKVRTEEHRKNYSLAAQKRWDEEYDKRVALMQTNEYREKQRVAFHENPNREEIKEKQRAASLKWWHDNPEQRDVKRELAIALLDEGKIGPQAPYKAEWKFNPFTQQEEYMHSSWESRFLDECIERNHPVTKKHDVRIDYVDPNGVQHVYVPDFLSVSGSVLFEVKGNETPVDEIKYQAASSWCTQNSKEFCVVRY